MQVARRFLLIAGIAVPLVVSQAKAQSGMERPNKALSDDEILAYLNGDADRWTRTAELNRYPGPKHVLELAPRLGLTEPQRQRVETIYETTRDRAMQIGRGIVSREAVLDSLFTTRTIDSLRLHSLVSEIAQLQGELRDAHLQASLAVTRLLAPDQILEYDRIRTAVPPEE